MTHAALSARMDGLRSSAIRDLLTLTARPDVISLAGGLPDPDFIPRERISKAAHDALGDPSSVQYGETSGLRRLREVIAERESSKIGRTLDVSEVVITHGSQQGLSLLAQVLLDAGDVVVVEEPAYTGCAAGLSNGAGPSRSRPAGRGRNGYRRARDETRRRSSAQSCSHREQFPQPARRGAFGAAASALGGTGGPIRVLGARGRPVRRTVLRRETARTRWRRCRTG